MTSQLLVLLYLTLFIGFKIGASGNKNKHNFCTTISDMFFN